MIIQDAFCPECPNRKNKRGHIIGEVLEVAETNYSGCGEDMVNCVKCGHGFAVSYKVDEITRAEDWDVEIEPDEPCQNPLELL